MEGHFAEGDGSFTPRVVHAKPPRRVEGGSWESLSSHKDAIKEVLLNSIEAGAVNQSLSRTSSSGSAPGSATGPDVSSVGSPIERNFLDYGSLNPSGASINFQQAEEDFQLQLALALRVAAEAAAVDDPILSENPSRNANSRVPGITKTEATAYRYWVSNCLSYDDRIEDGFYEIWGMSPYVWSMCTDSSELGRMPPLESLRAVSANEATFEVVLVDRNMDSSLRELEDKAIGLAYDSTEVLDMASKLSIMVANVMGGPVPSDEMLLDDWRESSSKLMQLMSSIVLPIGVLRVGLARHRALLFKVMADSVGLPCRLLRGSIAYGVEDTASVVVKCGDEKEWMVDLLANPGTIMPPDRRLAVSQMVISSPLKFERQGSSVSVLHWSRSEPTGMDGGNREDSPQRRIFPDAARHTDYSPRAYDCGGRNLPPKGHEFYRFEGVKGAINKAKGSSDDGSRERYGLVDLLDRPGLRSPEIGKGNIVFENTSRPLGGVVVEPQRAEGGQGYEREWSRVERRGTAPDEYVNFGNAGMKQLSLEPSDFEIAWDDIVVGERIGQGSYGKVSRADWQGSDVAVKVFLDQDLKTEALEEFKREVAIMSRLRHPNIVLFMGAVTKPPNLSIITEFCPRGSLFRLLHRPNRELDERKRIRMAVDVAKGMNYLHRCSPPVVHRDLKSPNLLVDKNWTVKVCDFGLSRQKHNTFLSSKSSAGTPEWMAPEVLRNEPSDEKSDVYSFGVILWELATLEVPWNGMNPIQVVGAVGFQHRRLPIPEHVDRSIAAIIQACWRTDSKLRPSFADLMQDLRNLQHRVP